jgi:dihydropteroate synthase
MSKPYKTQIAGIINITPDSFSDGGACVKAEDALARVVQLCEDGADMVDIGAESTRPDAVLLDAEEEWGRLSPVLDAAVRLAHDAKVKVSVDTRHALTAARALDVGVDVINVQSGLEQADMLAVLRDASCGVVMMHALTMPANPAVVMPPGCDVVAEVTDALACMADDLQLSGIARSRVIADIGIGFGKDAKQSLALIAGAHKIQHQLGLPLYVGHSRKSFMRLVTDAQAAARDDVTLAYSSLLMQQGVAWLRVHEVARHVTLRAAL